MKILLLESDKFRRETFERIIYNEIGTIPHSFNENTKAKEFLLGNKKTIDLIIISSETYTVSEIKSTYLNDTIPIIILTEHLNDFTPLSKTKNVFVMNKNDIELFHHTLDIIGSNISSYTYRRSALDHVQIESMNRNGIAEIYEKYISIFGSDIWRDSEMLESCFTLAKNGKQWNDLMQYCKRFYAHPERQNICSITGKTGIGKTTFIHRFFMDYQKENKDSLPIFIDYLHFGFIADTESILYNLINDILIEFEPLLDQKYTSNLDQSLDEWVVETLNYHSGMQISHVLGSTSSLIFNSSMFSDDDSLFFFKDQISESLSDIEKRMKARRLLLAAINDKEKWVRFILTKLLELERYSIQKYAYLQIERELEHQHLLSKEFLKKTFGTLSNSNRLKTLNYDVWAKKILKVLSKKFKIFIIHDNLDKMTSRHIERRIIREALIPMRENLTNVCFILSVRKSTHDYHIYDKKSLFNVMKFYEIELMKPSLKDILDKKIDFIIDEMNQEKVKLKWELDIVIEDFEKFLRLFLKQTGLKCLHLIDTVTAGNHRDALDLLMEGICSGHFDESEISKSYYEFIRRGREGTLNEIWSKGIQYHIFLMSIILNDKQFYCENNSYIINLFNNGDKKDKYNILSRYRIIKYLYDNTKEEETYISTEALVNDFKSIGYPKETIVSALKIMFNRGLITDQHYELIKPDEGGHQSIAITSAGRAYIDHIVNELSYTETIYFAIPVPDELYMDCRTNVPPPVLRLISENMVKLLKLEESIEEHCNYKNPRYKHIVGSEKISNVIRRSHQRQLDAIFKSYTYP